MKVKIMLLFKNAVLKPVMEELQEKGGNMLLVRDEDIYLMLGARSALICGQGEIAELLSHDSISIKPSYRSSAKRAAFFLHSYT